jgi:hypothetical protein
MFPYWVGCAPRGGARPVSWLVRAAGLLGCLGHAAGLLGCLGRVRGGGGSRLAGPTAGFRPTRLELKENSFYFSNCFIICKFEFNSNPNFDGFYLQNKISEHFTNQGKLCIGMKCNN